jgi:hypothetical protein
MATGENRVGSKQSRVERERERERQTEREQQQQINRVRDGVLDVNRNGVGCKWPLVKKDNLNISNNKSIG